MTIGNDATGSPVGVPLSYRGLTASGDQLLIQKGNLNKLRLRPQILNEHTESSRSLIATVDASTIVGQIFKASQDNINGINLTLLSAATLIVDDFESYADDAALQAAWVETDPSDPATLETVIVDEGLQSMKLPGDASTGDEWVLTIPSTDLTGYTGSIRIQQNFDYGTLKLRFFVGDGTNTRSAPVVVSAVNAWQRIEIAQTQLVEDIPGNVTDITNITKVGYRLEDRRNNALIYIDLMEAAPTPGALGIKLWDMGQDSPVSAANSIDDGAQYTTLGDAGTTGIQIAEIELDMVGGFRQYHIDEFVAGVAREMPANVLLTPGNYYALTLNYIDTDVGVYGPNPAYDNYYGNGYSFTAPDEATVITATGDGEDIQFGVFSTQDVYINGLFVNMAADPGTASEMLFNVEDDGMVITAVMVQGVRGQRLVEQRFDARPYLMPKGGKFELNYNDDASDEVAEIEMSFQYLFEPPVVNG